MAATHGDPSPTANDPAAEVVELCRDLIRIDTTNYGDQDGPRGAEGGRVRRRAARRGGHRGPALRVRARARTSLVANWGGTTGAPLLLHGHLDVVPAAAEDWQVRPVLRRDPRRLRLGPRRGRHEGLRRDAALGRPGADPRRARAGAADRALLHRRRGGRRPQGRRVPGPQPPRRARGLHRGGRRGRWLQCHDPRPAALPHRDRREGHGLDAAALPGSRRPRLDDQPRQRGDRAGRGGRPDRRRTTGPSGSPRP